MNIIIFDNFRNDEVPEINLNVYNSATKKVVYTCTMQFTGEQFVCHRVYNGKMIGSTLGHSFPVKYANLHVNNFTKPETIDIMKNAIACCVLQTVTVIRDLEKIFVDDVNIFPNIFAAKKKEIDKFIEDCYFMIS